MRFTITPAALDALRALLDERRRRGGNDDDPALVQAWLDAVCAEPASHSLLESAPRFSRERTALLAEAFNRGRRLLDFAVEREKLAARIEELDLAAAAL